MTESEKSLFESSIPSLPLRNRGKVRDIYTVDAGHLLIVTTDRLSAFDVVLPDPIPGKGAILTTLSNFWFARLAPIIDSHLCGIALEQVVPDPVERAPLAGRSVVVRRLRPLPIEAVVRGYLAGSGYRDYLTTATVCGIALPPGLRQAERLPVPIFTPATKAESGQHDENISFERVEALLGVGLARQVRDYALRIYTAASEYAASRGIIIADTKLEFGLSDSGELVLIDEALTPDSSRFWPVDEWRPGSAPPSFDKQFARDYLERLGWNKTPPAPRLPPDIISATARRYREAKLRLMGD